MKKFTFVKIILTSIALLASACRDEPGHDHIMFINNSNKNVYINDNDSFYPDTSITTGDLRKSGNNFLVKAHSSNGDILSTDDSWEYIIGLFNDTMMVVVFDADALGTIPWDTIVKNYMILKRYDLSVSDLDSMEWKITYP